MQNAKFNMLKIADQLNVSLEEVHNIVQGMLFSKGNRWGSGVSTVIHTDAEYLFFEEGWGITKSSDVDCFENSKYQEYTVKVDYAFEEVVEVVEEPLIELDGKLFSKAELKALVQQASVLLASAK